MCCGICILLVLYVCVSLKINKSWIVVVGNKKIKNKVLIKYFIFLIKEILGCIIYVFRMLWYCDCLFIVLLRGVR